MSPVRSRHIGVASLPLVRLSGACTGAQDEAPAEVFRCAVDRIDLPYRSSLYAQCVFVSAQTVPPGNAGVSLTWALCYNERAIKQPCARRPPHDRDEGADRCEGSADEPGRAARRHG